MGDWPIFFCFLPMHASRPRHSSASAHIVACRKSHRQMSIERSPPLPLLLSPPSASIQPRQVSLGSSNTNATAAPIMAAAADIFCTFSPPPWGRPRHQSWGRLCLSLRHAHQYQSRPLTPHGTLNQLPRRARCSRPTLAQMKTHRLSKSALVLSLIQGVLSGRGIGTSRPASPLRCCK
jgi:hypothetical protein